MRVGWNNFSLILTFDSNKKFYMKNSQSYRKIWFVLNCKLFQCWNTKGWQKSYHNKFCTIRMLWATLFTFLLTGWTRLVFSYLYHEKVIVLPVLVLFTRILSCSVALGLPSLKLSIGSWLAHVHPVMDVCRRRYAAKHKRSIRVPFGCLVMWFCIA